MQKISKRAKFLCCLIVLCSMLISLGCRQIWGEKTEEKVNPKPTVGTIELVGASYLSTRGEIELSARYVSQDAEGVPTIVSWHSSSITATAAPQNAATPQKATASQDASSQGASENSGSNKGIVRGANRGTASQVIITATSDTGEVASHRVAVFDLAIDGLEEVLIGKSITLIPHIEPSGIPIEAIDLAWSIQPFITTRTASVDYDTSLESTEGGVSLQPNTDKTDGSVTVTGEVRGSVTVVATTPDGGSWYHDLLVKELVVEVRGGEYVLVVGGNVDLEAISTGDAELTTPYIWSLDPAEGVATYTGITPTNDKITLTGVGVGAVVVQAASRDTPPKTDSERIEVYNLLTNLNTTANTLQEGALLDIGAQIDQVSGGRVNLLQIDWEVEPASARGIISIDQDTTTGAVTLTGTEAGSGTLVAKGPGGGEWRYPITVEVKPFILTYEIPATGVTDFTLPLRSSGANIYNLEIHWGDPKNPEAKTVATEASHGVYTYAPATDGLPYHVDITITGDLQFGAIEDEQGNLIDNGSWGSSSVNSNEYLVGVKSFGDVKFVNNTQTFRGIARNITFPAGLEGIPYLEGSISAMFQDAEAFNQDISHWNVSKVTDMSSMFDEADVFNNGGLSGTSNNPLSWENTSKLENANRMFRFAIAFNQDLNSWDISSVTNMSSMFSSAYDFNNGEPADINNNPLWAVEPGKPWQVKDTSLMFFNARKFNQDITFWDVSNVNNMARMFSGACFFNQDIGDWNVENVEYMNYMFSGYNSGSYQTRFNQDISRWNVSKVTDMSGMFSGAVAFNNGDAVVGASNNPLNWADKTGLVENMNSMFYNAYAFNQDVSSWDVTQVTDMQYMFRYAYKYEFTDAQGVTNRIYKFDNGGKSFDHTENSDAHPSWNLKGSDGTVVGSHMFSNTQIGEDGTNAPSWYIP